MQKRVGFGVRFFTALIDLVVMFVVANIATRVIGRFNPLLQWGNDSASITEVYVAVFLVCYTLVEAIIGQSVGKMVIGVVVCNPDGSRPKVYRRLVRWLIKFLPLILFPPFDLLSLVDDLRYSFNPPDTFVTRVDNLGPHLLVTLMVCVVAESCLMLGRKKQAGHDMIAGTVVLPRSLVGHQRRGFDPVMQPQSRVDFPAPR
jgi:uncharacterized RDD family membrane protein YckC